MTNYKDELCKCGHSLDEHENATRHHCCTHEDCTCDGFVLSPPIPKFVPQDCLLTQTKKDAIENCLRTFAMQVLAHKWIIQDKDVEQCRDMIIKVIENG